MFFATKRFSCWKRYMLSKLACVFWRRWKMINLKTLPYSQVFFVIRLNGRKTPETSDPDPLMNCDIMDGRDAFLTLAREKHYEFSSLRRATFSTMAMLVELHNQGHDRFVYSCNICKRSVETRYHCNECEVYKQSLSSVVVNIRHIPCRLVFLPYKIQSRSIWEIDKALSLFVYKNTKVNEGAHSRTVLKSRIRICTKIWGSPRTGARTITKFAKVWSFVYLNV